MSEVEKPAKVAVFGGATGGTPSKEGLRTFKKEWESKGKDWKKMEKEGVEALDAMWLAADIGRVLAENRWQLVTGGYNMGTMGMVNRAAVLYGKGENQPTIGVPLKEYFPDDPHVEAELLSARNLSERLGQLLDSDAFIILRGAHGTLNELTSVIEEEDCRDEARKIETVKVPARPIIVADPSGKMKKLLTYIFTEYAPAFMKDTEQNILDRIYILEDDCFEVRREHPLSATTRLTEKGESEVVNILDRFSRHGNDQDIKIDTPTLRKIIEQKNS